jgi:hypothetical protein
MSRLDDIVRQATEELDALEYRLAVDELKRRMLAKQGKPWWRRLLARLPFAITFNWRKS